MIGTGDQQRAPTDFSIAILRGPTKLPWEELGVARDACSPRRCVAEVRPQAIQRVGRLDKSEGLHLVGEDSFALLHDTRRKGIEISSDYKDWKHAGRLICTAVWTGG